MLCMNRLACSGIVFPGGSEVYLYDDPFYSGLLDATIRGYLTAN